MEDSWLWGIPVTERQLKMVRFIRVYTLLFCHCYGTVKGINNLSICREVKH